MSMVNGSAESTWGDSRTEVMVWKLNSAHQKADWYAWRTACDSVWVFASSSGFSWYQQRSRQISSIRM